MQQGTWQEGMWGWGHWVATGDVGTWSWGGSREEGDAEGPSLSPWLGWGPPFPWGHSAPVSPGCRGAAGDTVSLLQRPVPDEGDDEGSVQPYIVGERRGTPVGTGGSGEMCGRHGGQHMAIVGGTTMTGPMRLGGTHCGGVGDPDVCETPRRWGGGARCRGSLVWGSLFEGSVCVWGGVGVPGTGVGSPVYPPPSPPQAPRARSSGSCWRDTAPLGPSSWRGRSPSGCAAPASATTCCGGTLCPPTCG